MLGLDNKNDEMKDTQGKGCNAHREKYRQPIGLYDPACEHDACGVGMIVDIHGNKSHELVDSALKVLENMKHRGAEGAE